MSTLSGLREAPWGVKMLPEVLNRHSDEELVAQTDRYDCASWHKAGNLGLCTFHPCSRSYSGSNFGKVSYAATTALTCCSGDKTG